MTCHLITVIGKIGLLHNPQNGGECKEHTERRTAAYMDVGEDSSIEVTPETPHFVGYARGLFYLPPSCKIFPEDFHTMLPKVNLFEDRPYRNRQARFGLRVKVIAGIDHWKLK